MIVKCRRKLCFKRIISVLGLLCLWIVGVQQWVFQGIQSVCGRTKVRFLGEGEILLFVFVVILSVLRRRRSECGFRVLVLQRGRAVVGMEVGVVFIVFFVLWFFGLFFSFFIVRFMFRSLLLVRRALLVFWFSRDFFGDVGLFLIICWIIIRILFMGRLYRRFF